MRLFSAVINLTEIKSLNTLGIYITDETLIRELILYLIMFMLLYRGSFIHSEFTMIFHCIMIIFYLVYYRAPTNDSFHY